YCCAASPKCAAPASFSAAENEKGLPHGIEKIDGRHANQVGRQHLEAAWLQGLAMHHPGSLVFSVPLR
ncbi:MAG TPA: hypothetical protein VMP00_07250, partial [Burkholderiales bacterium]|nr:hypothetical protein [Burkholderiales bacterium]